MFKLAIYVLSLIFSCFALSGVNFDKFIKTNHVWEARVLLTLLAFSLTYLVANFILDISSLTLI